MKKLMDLVSVTGIQRPGPSLVLRISTVSSDDCPAPGDGDDDGGGADCH